MSEWQEISASKTNDKMETEDVHLIDVRDPDSYHASHIPGAIQFTTKQEADEFIEGTDKESPVIIYCYHGNSSRGVASFLAEQGFKEVYSMTGGFESWHLSYPTEP